MIYSKSNNEKGVVLLLTLLILIIISAVTISFLYMTSIQTKTSGAGIVDSQAFWIAEAGMQKAAWNLMTPVVNGGQGENWTTGGITENIGNGSYSFQVGRWDWALQSNNAAASASSGKAGFDAVNAIDGNDTTYWKSANKPTSVNPEYIVIVFPYTLKINKARFIAPAGWPIDYDWQVSTDGTSYTTTLTVTSNSDVDRTDEFHPAQINVNYLKLSISKTDTTGGESTAVVATLEAVGSKITSAGTVDGLSRRVEQTLAIDDGAPTIYDAAVYTPTAYDQIDWKEIP
jgi:Tfp pilus assembly protein PilX